MSTFDHILVGMMSIPILIFGRFCSLQIPYTNQGFFCDDDEIRYPERIGTITSESMFVLYAIIVIILVPLSETSLSVRHGNGSGKWFNKDTFLKTLFFYTAYTCGVLATSVATNVFKRTSSRLRPDFIAVCKPKDLDQICPLGSNKFVENFICLGETRADEHFSFPSSHASQSLFFATFMIAYLHKRFRFINIIRSFTQYVIFLVSIYICLSRVRDFKHRYVDVAGGGILGIVLGLGMVHIVLFNFKHHRYVSGESGECVVEVREEKNSLLRSGYSAIATSEIY